MFDTSNRRFKPRESPHSFLFEGNKAQGEMHLLPPPPPLYPNHPYPLSDALPACTANKVRPLHDKVQSRIIKLEKDRETERNWHRHQTERKGLVRGRTQRSGSGANFWIGALKKTVPISLPTHTHTPPTPLPPKPLWCICHDEKKKKTQRCFLIFCDCWHYESLCLCGLCTALQ